MKRLSNVHHRNCIRKKPKPSGKLTRHLIRSIIRTELTALAQESCIASDALWVKAFENQIGRPVRSRNEHVIRQASTLAFLEIIDR